VLLLDLVTVNPSLRNLRALINDKRSFIVLSDRGGDAYPILCIDSKSGTLKWKAESWGFGGDNLPLRLGSWSHEVKLVVTPKQLAIFGTGPHSCYLEAFDAETGAASLRFSTNSWYRDDD
jgi:hypothetical protein